MLSAPFWGMLFGLFLIAHGIGHAAGLFLGNRVFGVLWLAGLVGFVTAGLAFFRLGVPHELWRPLVIASAVLSTLLIALFWSPSAGPKINALVANAGILLAVLWWHWPAPAPAP